jgi:O-antigen/teichoic acid export membrane protein
MKGPGFLREAVAKRLQGRQALRRALGNSIWLFSDQFFRMGTAMLTGVLIARYLGPARFGWLNYATAAVAMANSLTELGINSIVVRELVREQSKTSELMGAAWLVRGAGAILGVVGCVGVYLSGLAPNRVEGLLIAILGFGLLFRVFDLFDLLLQANGVPRISAWIRAGANTIATIGKLALIVLGAPVETFAVAAVLEIALYAVGWWWVGRGRGWHVSRWRPDGARIRSLLRESWPLTISGLAVYTQAYADQLVVGSMLGASQLGQYAAAMRLVNVFSFLPVVVQIVAAPEIARAKMAGDAVYAKRLHDVYRLMMCLFLAVAVPLMLFGPAVVRMLYGSAYDGASGLLPWLAFRLFFTNFGVARSMYITNDRLFRFALLTAIAGGATNVLMNLLLVPHWGVLGAIASSLAAFAVTTFALEIFERNARKNLWLMLSAVLMPWRPLPVV